MAVQLAQRLGIDADRPRHLQKGDAHHDERAQLACRRGRRCSTAAPCHARQRGRHRGRAHRRRDAAARAAGRRCRCTPLPDGAWLAPGFIDVQVNGGGDVLFNDAPTPEAIAAIAAAHRRFGTTSLLPTLISDTPEKMRDAHRGGAERCGGQPGRARHSSRRAVPVAGEAGRARSAPCSARPTRATPKLLTSWRDGVTLVTLAPEQVPAGFIARAGARRRARLARAFDGDLCADARRRSRKASPASRICSMPCARWRAASRARSPRRWKRPASCSA